MPTMHLLPASFLLGLTLICGIAQAQTTNDDPVAGKALFENTASASGNAGLASCISCHGSVEARRSQLSGSGDSYADITFDTAMTRFTAALANQPDMRPLRVLTNQQVRNIAAYLADTPKTTPVSETQLNFSAALNGNSAAQTVTLKHSTAVNENLQVTSVAAIGTGAANFVLGKSGCEGVTLTPANSCSITVTYAPSTSAVSTPDLVFTMKQGASTTTFERVLFLNGSIASTTPPADDSGGGALGLGWLVALGGAVAALARRRRA
jgi:cytochrome c553